jgi:Uma2 family endonuclease
MAQTSSRKKLTAQEYINGELASNIRHEFLGGDVYAMVGASANHNLICINIVSALHRHLSKGPCQVFMADMKVRLHIAFDEYFYYPDILVSCRPDDRATYYKEHPVVLIEVLSESTERLDRREKLFAYQHIKSLEEYVLIGQSQREITVFRRSVDWGSHVVPLDEKLEFRSLDFRIAFDDIYAGVAI